MINNHEDYWASVTVERKILDKYLAQKAAMCGAVVQADTRLVSLEMDGDMIREAELIHRGERVWVKPKVVVAADGVHSTISKLIGRRVYPEGEVANGVEFEMVSKANLPPCMQIFLEPEIGLGYGWIIPKGKRRANVGLGIVGEVKGRSTVLRDWIETNPLVSRYFDMDGVLEVKSGEAPIPGYSGGPWKGNVLFAGDSAGQTLAFVGEGIIPSFACGRIAGSVASLASQSGDLSLLRKYDGILGESMGEELRLGAGIKDLIVRTWMRPDISFSTKVVACGLLMCDCLDPGDLFRMTRDELMEITTLSSIRERLSASSRNVKVSPVHGR
jgi:digeranylgeranylglycerophospholipid reductase